MKKKILDIMIDFETFGTQPNSVPINLAVVAWNRYAEENPFVIPGVKNVAGVRSALDLPCLSGSRIQAPSQFNSRFVIFHFDVCACLLKGMTLEPKTQQWWMDRPECDKDSLVDAARTQQHPWIVVENFIDWFRYLKKETGVDDICIWSQGSDFDIAKLRWLIGEYPYAIDDDKLFQYTNFRDARTVILELGNKLFDGKRGFSVDLSNGVMVTDGKPNTEDEVDDFHCIYDKIVPIEAWAKQLQMQDDIATGHEGVMSNYLYQLAIDGQAHNSIYDCMRSIYNVWWLNKALDTQLI